MLAGAAVLALLLPAAGAWAGPPMSTGSNSIPRSVFAAGGSSATTAANAVVFTVGEEVAFSTGATAANKARAGWPTIASFPNAVTALIPLSDNTVSSATFQWATPGYDGGRGLLQKGSSYILQVASYTAPSVFADTAFITLQVSTNGQPLGGTVGSGVTGLLANTTYFVQLRTLDNDGDASLPFMSTVTTLANPPVVGASEFLMVSPSSYTLTIGSVTVAWIAGQLSPPDASSMSTGGYVLQASSDDFGAIALPTPAPVFSSTTYSVLASTLTVGTAAPLDLTATYYFRVASLNWKGQPNWAVFNKLNFQAQLSTGMIHFGTISPFIARSTVSTSSMVVTNVGNWPVTITLAASTATVPASPWGLAVSSGPDTVALLGVWNAGPPGPPASAFNTPLTSTPLPSQAAGNYAGGQNGFQISPGQSRTLWFLLWLPTSSTTVGPETIRVDARPVYP